MTSSEPPETKSLKVGLLFLFSKLESTLRSEYNFPLRPMWNDLISLRIFKISSYEQHVQKPQLSWFVLICSPCFPGDLADFNQYIVTDSRCLYLLISGDGRTPAGSPTGLEIFIAVQLSNSRLWYDMIWYDMIWCFCTFIQGYAVVWCSLHIAIAKCLQGHPQQHPGKASTVSRPRPVIQSGHCKTVQDA